MKKRTIQKIYDLKLNQRRQSLFERLKNRCIDFIFNKLKGTDAIVEAYIGDFKLKVPISHHLPFILKVEPYYSLNLVRIAEFVNQKYSDLKFIDVGANIGDSVALLRKKTKFPILCIEGDSTFYSILNKNLTMFSDVYMSKNYVGEYDEEIKAKPVELSGTAHLNQNKFGDNIINIKRLSTLLEDFPLFKTTKMLKIDTDGFDNKIIRGALDLLEIARPVVFFEYDPFFLSKQNDGGINIFKMLLKIGYKNLLVYENRGEFMLSVDLNDYRLLEDINCYFTGRKGLIYCDICAFHNEDADLFETIRRSEMQFFIQSRI